MLISKLHLGLVKTFSFVGKLKEELSRWLKGARESRIKMRNNSGVHSDEISHYLAKGDEKHVSHY